MRLYGASLAILVAVLPATALRAETPSPSDSTLQLLAERATNVFTQRCHNCHGVDFMHENLNVLDFAMLTAPPASPEITERRYVSPGKPEDSLIWAAIEDDRMPPKTALTSVEKKAVRDWIEAGAPELLASEREFVSEVDVLKAISAHLFSTRREDRRFQRYITIQHIHNNRHTSDRDLALYRAAISKAVNSMSRQASIVVPRAIDDQRTVFAIDLREYGWQDFETWQAVLREYPYGLKPQSSIEELELYEKIEELYGAVEFDGITHIRGDWFVATATRPPLYHALTEIPETLEELLKRTNVSIEDNFRLGTSRRGGLFESGVSAQNRLIEYHSSINGTFWISYDFSENATRGNLSRFPLGPDFDEHPFATLSFKHDGGEIIYNLPNGLHAYMLVDGNGKRIDSGPVDIVWDPLQISGSPLIVNGLSCISCHKNGMIDFQDFVRDGSAVQSAQARRKVRELYPPQEELQRALASSRVAYLQKLREAVGTLLDDRGLTAGDLTSIEEPISRVAVLYRKNLDLETAARELGFEDISHFRSNLSSGRLAELGMGPLIIENGTIKRSYWHSRESAITIFQQVASELRVGSPYKN